MSLRFDGIEDLKRDLLNLPKEFQAEAGHIVQARANAATAKIKAAYPKGPTGNLRNKVSVSYDLTSGVAASAVVKNTARHAWLFENGSDARHYVTHNGVRHVTGRMPAAHTFIPRVMAERRLMYVDLKDMLRRKGLTVSGDA